MRSVLKVAAAAALLLPSSGLAGERCPFPILANAEMPGLELDTLLQEVRSPVPPAAGCDDRERITCSFIDAQGYLNVFTEIGPIYGQQTEDRWLFRREAERSRGATPPYGVSWSDSEATVGRRVNEAGASPTHKTVDGRRLIYVGGCKAPGLGDPFLTTFEFGADGRLERVIQATNYP